ncbi:MAG: Na/Pi cotransporter family protein [Bacteroidetes bacterium]|nr:Na/Pi cotransporter family protein [Bacteroidota bacterium]MBU1579244.1 Na/Pi cotransporter family protein [Bacteroidota bacterium]MBU2557313.1 Na/Pi cotransporter family protein [Bacteroidota bacterium]
MNVVSFIYDILSVFGALAFFLFGMKLMSESLQKIAGVKMRQYLSAVTANRWRGLFTGFIITATMQSSSAVTVLLVGFVNASLITVGESVALIMGANIGTTLTSWLITFFGYSFNIRVIILPLIALSIPLYFTSNSRKKSLAEFILGFAILFIGLQFLRDVLPEIHGEAGVIDLLKSVTGQSFIPIMIVGFMGIILTIIIQSSTATIALTIVLLSEGMISFEVAAALIVGENIGTTATANIAALVANRDAKRTALIHTLFNIIGALILIPFFNAFVQGIEQLADKLLLISTNDSILAAPLKVSLFHSIFNITNTLLLIGLSKYLLQASYKIIPIKPNEKDSFPLQLGDNFMTTVSELSIVHASREILNMAHKSQKMLTKIPLLLLEKNPTIYNQLNEEVKLIEQQVDQAEQTVMQYLARLTESKLSAESSRMVNGNMIIVNNIESIADICFKMARVIELKNSQKAWFNQNQRDNLHQMFQLAEEAIDIMLNNLKQPKKPDISQAEQLEKQINNLKITYLEAHYKDMKASVYPFNSGNFYQQLIVYCEKIGDHTINVSETLKRSY